jgi:predicted SnoaL-like aldol condensation-catalyzing enzyme
VIDPSAASHEDETVDALKAAERWAHGWENAWPQGDVEAIVRLYAPGAIYRSHPHRAPEEGGARGYVTRQFREEEAVTCRFGSPIAVGDRAAVEWWASWVEGGGELTLSGATVLRFDEDGQVVEHLDYWADSPGRLGPFPGWGGSPRE